MLRMEEVGADHDTIEAIRQQMTERARAPKLVLPKVPEHVEAPKLPSVTPTADAKRQPQTLTVKAAVPHR